MEFIRHEKHKPNYNPNTSHCIFGQDGDLVMLGLAMHEPHTCLLREEVVFDPTRKKAKEKLAKLEGEMVASGGENNDIDDSNGVERLEMSITESNQPTLSGAVQSYSESQLPVCPLWLRFTSSDTALFCFQSIMQISSSFTSPSSENILVLNSKQKSLTLGQSLSWNLPLTILYL